TCEETQELLGGYLARSLAPEGVERVEAHLATCERCRRLNATVSSEGGELPGTLPPAPLGPAGDLSALSARLLEAHAMLKGVAHRTAVVTSQTLDDELDANVYLKCENLQRMGAFK